MSHPPAAGRIQPERPWIAFIAIYCGVFMAFLDIQVVASSINQIQAGLGATRSEIGWVQSSYLIAEVIAIPLSGYLSRLLSTRVYFALSVLGFTVASAACAFAWSIESMIVFRAIQGFLGGGMIPSSFAALFQLFPEEKRLPPQIVAGLITTIAPTMGPVLGGWITGAWSWHWLFLVNVLPGLVVTLVVWTRVHIDEAEPQIWKLLDVQGVVWMSVFLGSMEWILEEGPTKGWFEDTGLCLWAAVCVCAAVLFFTRVFTCEHPIIDLTAFADRNFTLACAASFTLSGSLVGVNFILPLFLGQVRGFDSIHIGNTLMMSGVSLLFASLFAQRLTRLFDLRVLYAGGVALMALGTWHMAHLTSTTGSGDIQLGLFVRGMGSMMAFVCCATVSLATLPHDRLKNGSSIYSLMRNLGGALWLAVLNSVMQYQTNVHVQNLSESLRASRVPVQDAIAAGGGSEVGMAVISMRLHEQAAVMTYNDALLLVVMSMLMAMPMLLFTRRTAYSTKPPVEVTENAAPAG